MHIYNNLTLACTYQKQLNDLYLKPLYTFGTEKKEFTDLQITYRVNRR